MNIEIVEFYPLEQNDQKQSLTGTLHVYLCDLDVDLRGVFVSKKKGFWHFQLPSRKVDDEKGETVRYPIFNFASPDKQRALIAALQVEGKRYIEDWLKEAKKERACV